MKKTIFITLMVLLLVPAFAFSQEKSPGTDTSMGMGKGMHCNCGKICMMMQKQMIATSDGGVIVLSGNKLYKYDKNLNLVKEAEIKMDVEGMKKMMEKMKEACPASKMMMEKKEESKTQENKE